MEGCKEVIETNWAKSKLPTGEERRAQFNLKGSLNCTALALSNWGKSHPSFSRMEIAKLEKWLEYILNQPGSSQVCKEISQLREKINQMRRTEEEYWAQRSRVDWLRTGDSNSKFFHAVATTRKRNNRINGLYSEDGRWQNDEEGMSRVMIDYFTDSRAMVLEI